MTRQLYEAIKRGTKDRKAKGYRVQTQRERNDEDAFYDREEPTRGVQSIGGVNIRIRRTE